MLVGAAQLGEISHDTGKAAVGSGTMDDPQAMTQIPGQDTILRDDIFKYCSCRQ